MLLNFSRENAGPSKIIYWWTSWYISGNLLVLFFSPSALEPRPQQCLKIVVQLPGTDVVEKLARLVGASSDRAEWWARPFTLDIWGEVSFIAKLQGWSTAKRLRTSPAAVGCNEQIGYNY